MFGGHYFDSTEILDLATLEWRHGASMPSPVHMATGNVYSGKLILAGGTNGNDYLK